MSPLKRSHGEGVASSPQQLPGLSPAGQRRLRVLGGGGGGRRRGANDNGGGGGSYATLHERHRKVKEQANRDLGPRQWRSNW